MAIAQKIQRRSKRHRKRKVEAVAIRDAVDGDVSKIAGNGQAGDVESDWREECSGWFGAALYELNQWAL